MAGRIATINGTMLVPGVSRNKRLYSRELIAKAAARMSERIADPKGLPIVMRTHHEAGDDSVRIVGRLTGVNVGEDGAARYTADLYDTTHGRDIAGLVAPGKGQPPALRSVSIHGYWLGPVKTVQHEGESVTAGDDLEIDALDFTATPGVLGASVDDASLIADGPPTEESAAGRTPISESVDATVQAVTETAPPIRTKADVRRAVREARDNLGRAHVIQRATALGHTALIPGTWKADGSMQENTRYSELREYYPDGPSGQAGFCIDAYNGPMSITMRSCSIDPSDLRAIAAAAMTAAVNALQALDPDMDADLDVTGAPAADTDADGGKGESAPADGISEAVPPAVAGQPLLPRHAAALRESGALNQLQPGEHVTAAAVNEALTQTTRADQAGARTHQEEAAMAETNETAAPARSTDTDITVLAAAIGAALKESLAPLHAALAENAAKPKHPAADETVTAAADAAKAERKAEKKALKESLAAEHAALAAEREALKTSIRDELREEFLRENGLPSRQGYRVHESDRAPDNAADLFEDRTNILLGQIGLAPQPAK